MSGKEIKTVKDWPLLFDSYAIVHILPGVLCGIALFALSSYFQHFLVLPVSLATILLSFYTLLVICGLSFDDVRQNGWVAYPPAKTSTPIEVFDVSSHFA